tara:strand:- start:363 stop:614 length:252 start_codon:yes stop_codon:yes gene_type:complete
MKHCEPVELELVGLDGNAFALMGAWKKTAHRAGRTPEEIRAVIDDCTSGDYNHLLGVLVEHTSAPPEFLREETLKWSHESAMK